jgi:membrane protein YdbS with pleckstrin-like domain
LPNFGTNPVVPVLAKKDELLKSLKRQTIDSKTGPPQLRRYNLGKVTASPA